MASKQNGRTQLRKKDFFLLSTLSPGTVNLIPAVQLVALSKYMAAQHVLRAWMRATKPTNIHVSSCIAALHAVGKVARTPMHACMHFMRVHICVHLALSFLMEACTPTLTA